MIDNVIMEIIVPVGRFINLYICKIYVEILFMLLYITSSGILMYVYVCVFLSTKLLVIKVTRQVAF